MALILILYILWLDVVTLAFSVINILINNLEHLSNNLKDYLESNNISVTNLKDISIQDDLSNETKTNIDSQTLDTNPNNLTPSEEVKPFYKTKSFWISASMYLIMATICFYKMSSGDVTNNIEINNINNLTIQDLVYLNLQDLNELEEFAMTNSALVDSIIDDIKTIHNFK
jgi:hypothetical protein